MLGWLLLGLASAACATAAVIIIHGCITRSKMEDAMKAENLEAAIVESISKCDNRVKLKDLDSDRTFELQGDSISHEISEGDYIFA